MTTVIIDWGVCVWCHVGFLIPYNKAKLSRNVSLLKPRPRLPRSDLSALWSPGVAGGGTCNVTGQSHCLNLYAEVAGASVP
jgi:hypothetical protein